MATRISRFEDAVADAFGGFPVGAQFSFAYGDLLRRAHDPSERVLGTVHEEAFNVYCAGKPLLVIAALRALHQNGVAIDASTALAELAGYESADTACTLGDLLSHRTGCAEPDLYSFMSSSPQRQAQLVPTISGLTSTLGGTAYSPVILSAALDEVLRRRTGRDLTSATSDLTSHLNLVNTFVRDGGHRPIGAYVDASGRRPLPLLHDRLDRYRNSKYGHLTGMYTTANDLAVFGQAMNDWWHGDESVLGLPTSMLSDHLRHSESSHDHGERYTLGFSHLKRNGLFGAADAAVGHFGFVRSSLLYMDGQFQRSVHGPGHDDRCC